MLVVTLRFFIGRSKIPAVVKPDLYLHIYLPLASPRPRSCPIINYMLWESVYRGYEPLSL